jgi:glutaredoxin
MPKIKIFSTTWCAFCRAEKKFLDEHHIAYTAVDVDENQAAADEMMHLSGQMGVPFTVITRDDGQQVGIIGFDRPRLSAELGI